MISKDVSSPPLRVSNGGPDAERDLASEARDVKMSRLVPPWMKASDYEAADYDPYNTGAFRVLSERQPRRTLDDMRKLDEEIRRRRHRYW